MERVRILAASTGIALGMALGTASWAADPAPLVLEAKIRLDSWRDQIVVGYGKGALAVIDPASRRKIGDLPLKGHPESFQFDETGARIFANVPDARQIAVLDVGSGQQTATLDAAGATSNFPMAVDADEHRL